MTLLLKQIFNFIRLLHSENGTYQIVWGLTLGAFLGFSPFFSLQTFLILGILLIFKIQFGAAFLSSFFFKFIAYLFDPAADLLGRWVLELPSLRSVWSTLYNMPIIPYTRFNNSIVMGSFVFVLLISPILFLGFKTIIIRYRTHIVHRFEQTKAWKAFKATKFYEWYMKYDDLYGTK